ncbi:MAG: 1-acyl-sn-glycerol-3-phosphate acyltransferase [Crocinitomicaceae bacterium]|jgi:1-acyl-sn-glycerol-3-phosphate acyltransferase
MRKLPSFILRLFGWKIDQHTPAGVAKCVIVMGPHTSNWDFIIGKMSFMRFGIKGRYLIKKEAFKFPFGWMLKRMGGIPVDRNQKNNITDQAVQLFKDNDSLYLVFTPEGTRDFSPNWKKGFYYIAQKANVPIYIGYIDYKKKIGGFHSVFEPTGDVDKDILYIKGILSQFEGKYPEKGIRLED